MSARKPVSVDMAPDDDLGDYDEEWEWELAGSSDSFAMGDLVYVCLKHKGVNRYMERIPCRWDTDGCLWPESLDIILFQWTPDEDTWIDDVVVEVSGPSGLMFSASIWLHGTKTFIAEAGMTLHVSNPYPKPLLQITYV